MIPFLYLKVLIIWSIIFYFINQRHANIKFTRENEADNKLAFRYVAVIKSGNVFWLLLGKGRTDLSPSKNGARIFLFFFGHIIYHFDAEFPEDSEYAI